MIINLYDAMNWVRVQSREDPTGRYPRSVLTRMSHPTGMEVWVWDGSGNKEARQKIYPAYKAKRTDEGEDFWAFINLIRDVLNHTHATQIQVPGVEADDVIATLARRYVGSHDVRIHSTDRDFTQLLGEGIRTTAEPKAGVDPSRVRLFKTLVGDASDNIPGARGFGEKSWARLSSENLDEIERAVQGLSYDRHRTGLADRHLDDLENLKIYWQIIGFIDVPIDLIDRHTSHGDRDFAAGDAYLKKYLH